MNELFDNLSEEDAQALLEQVRQRMPHHDFSISLAMADVLETPLPEGTDVKELDAEMWGIGFGLIAKSMEAGEP